MVQHTLSRSRLTAWLITLACLLLLPLTGLFAQVISTVAGSGGAGYLGDGGPALNAVFNNPISVATGPPNTIYISDNNNFRIRRVDLATGVITRIAGTGTPGSTGDGGPATAARIQFPGDLVADQVGNVYFCDGGNFKVRRVDGVTGIITTVLGGGSNNYNGGSATAVNAAVTNPYALALDPSGQNLYVALWPSSYIVRLNLATGIMTQVAGNGGNGDSGDGGNALLASFNMPAGLALDPAGNLFIADALAHRVRRVGTDGIINTVAGTGAAGNSGIGGGAIGASLDGPTGVAPDADGNIFIADRGNNLVKRIDAVTGIISINAGNGTRGFAGDGQPANSPCVQLSDPQKVRFDNAGNYFIADQSNGRIRMVNNGTGPPPLSPEITIAADNATICTGTTINFTATTVNTTGPVDFQWRIDGTPSGTNSSQFSSSTLTDGQVVTCDLVSSSGCGADLVVESNEITVTITSSVTASITIEASDLTICSGEPVTFTATILNGGTSPVYQWTVDGVNAGTNSPTLTLPSPGNGTRVNCTLTSNAGCLSSNDPVVSDDIAIAASPPFDPQVSIAAGTGAVCAGATAYFTATTNASQMNPVFEWTVNGAPAGTNDQLLSINTLENGDLIRCRIVLDPAAQCLASTSALSNEVIAVVNDSPPATISVTATDNSLCEGESATLNAVAANGGTGAGFQWLVNGNELAGATSPTLTRAFNNNDIVSCRLQPGADVCPSPVVVSDPVTFTVSPQPQVNVSSDEIFISAGAIAQLPASFSNDVTDYSWSPASLLQSATVASPMTRPLTADQVFTVSASNAGGCSAEGTITVKIFTDLFIPSAFSPNNDGLNDVFRIPPGVMIDLDEFAVFNRWGQKIFSTKNAGVGWDGTRGAEAMPAGVYVFQVIGKQAQKKVFVKGTVTLVR